jgi:hypothetical protein
MLYRILSFASFILDTPATSPNSVLCSRLSHSTDLETHHNQSAPPSYNLHPLPNQSPKTPGNITGIISPGLWAPAHQWSSHPAIPCEAPATRKLKVHPNAACSKNIFISQPLHAYTTSTTRRFLDPTKHHIAAHRVTDVAFVSVAFFLIVISEAVTCDLPRQTWSRHSLENQLVPGFGSPESTAAAQFARS